MGTTGSDTVAGAARRDGVPKTYDAFISYDHADQVLAAALQDGLQHLAKRWNRRRAMEVFRDQTSLPASSGLEASLYSVLDASRW